MNGLFLILLFCCLGNNNSCRCANNCVAETENRNDCEERERTSCSLNEREAVWTPYMGNNADRDNDCGCERTY